jgi:hypothetical protein
MPKSKSVLKVLSTLALILAIIVAAGALGLGGYVIYHDKGQPDSSKAILDHILAVVAILFGVIAFFLEWRLHHDFETQKADIKDIILSVHTRYLGEWPQHLRDITNLVSTASVGDDLWIAVDFLGYGTFSNPDEYSRYFEAVLDANRKSANIRILLHNEEMAIESFKKQFGQYKEGEHFNELKSKLEVFQKKYSSIVKTVPSNYDEFLQAALLVQNALCLQLTSIVSPLIQVATINAVVDGGPSPSEGAFYWIARRAGRRAAMVFAYPKYIGCGKGYGFETRDDALMEIFESQFDNKWRNATILEHGKDLFPKTMAAAAGKK